MANIVKRRGRGQNRIVRTSVGSGGSSREQVPVEIQHAFIYQKCGGGRRVIRKKIGGD